MHLQKQWLFRVYIWSIIYMKYNAIFTQKEHPFHQEDIFYLLALL